MKQKVMSAALLGLFAASAHAQTPTSVTLYGIVDGNLRVDHTTIGTLKSVGSGGENGTRWGIRGTEDLGNGLKAFFNFEQGVDIGDNSSSQGNVTPTTPTSPVSSTGGRIFGRTAIVGLSSATFGDVRIGRAYTPFYVSWSSIDPMNAGLVGGAQNYAVGNTSRFDNAVYYDSPKFYGFQLNAAYRLGESTTDSIAAGATEYGGNAYNASLTYSAGPILASYSYMNTRNATDTNTTRTQFAGAAYDLKFLKLHGLVFRTKDDATVDLLAYGLGVTVPYGAFTFWGQGARIDNRYDRNNSTLKNNDANFFGLGANYSFSKRTDVYTSWAKQVNMGNAIFVVTDATNAGLMTTTGATANVTPGFNPWSAQIGIRHRF